MRLVLIESPYAGERVWLNIAYAKAAMRDCLKRGEYPLAAHLLYPQPGILDDNKPDQRRLGLLAGLAWGDKADVTACYTDMGISSGMIEGMARAEAQGRPIEWRRLKGNWRRS